MASFIASCTKHIQTNFRGLFQELYSLEMIEQNNTESTHRIGSMQARQSKVHTNNSISTVHHH